MEKSFFIIFKYIFVFFYFITLIKGSTDYGKCVDPHCTVPIGQGLTITKYYSLSSEKLSFQPNELVDIYVKEFGKKKDLYGVVKKGEKGYISKKLIKETKTFHRTLQPAKIDFIIGMPQSQMNQNYHGSITQNSKFHQEIGDKSKYHQEFLSFSHKSRESLHIPHSPNLQLPITSHISNEHQLPSQGIYESLSSLESSILSQSSDSRFGSVVNSRTEDEFKGTIDNLSPTPTSRSIKPLALTEGVLSSDDKQLEESISFIRNMCADDQKCLDEYLLSLETTNVYTDSSQAEPTSQNHLSYENFISSSIQPNVNSRSYSLSNSDEKEFHSKSVQDHNVDYSHSDDEVDLDDEFESEIEDYDEESYEPFEPSPSQKNIDIKASSSNSDTRSNILVQKETENIQIKSTSSSNSDTQPNTLVQKETENIQIKPTSSSSSPNILKETSMLNDLSKSESIHQEIKETNISSLIESSINLSKEKDTNLQPEFHSPSHEYINKKSTDVNKASMQNVLTASTQLADISQTPNYDKMSNKHEPNEIVDNSYFVGQNLDEKNKFQKNIPQKTSLKTDEPHLKDNQFQNKEQSDKNSFSLDSSIVDNSILHNLKLNENKQKLNDEFYAKKAEHQTDSEPKYSKKINPDIVSFHSNLISEELNKNDYLNETKLDKILSYDFDDNMSFIHNKKHPLKEDNINNISELEPQDASNLEKNKEHFDSNISTEETLTDLSDLYHIRQLKEESTSKISQESSSEFETEENLTEANFNVFENVIEALRLFLDYIILWIPEPFYSYIMDYDAKGLSARVTVFTALSSIPCFLIFVSSLYLKRRSKENKLLAELIAAEKNIFSLSAEKIILDEQLQKTHSELVMLQQNLAEESLRVNELQTKLDDSHDHTKDLDLELKNCLEEIDLLKDKEDEYITLLSDLQKEKIYLQEQNEHLEQRLKEEEDKILELTNNLEQKEKEIQELTEEKQNLLISQNESSEKLIQLQQNCNQLLQEAEVWNLRVNELTSQLEIEATLKEGLENSNKTKDEEIESLKYIIDSLQALENEDNSENSEVKTKEEKIQTLIDTSKVRIQLQKEQAENVLLSEKLSVEKTKALDMEVELLEAKSEIDKLRINYNQALQDKAEAQTKLDVLTNYFKDKELQLQKELGAQEAVRQKKEEDASSAERKISLIEKENESYKYQVASIKQEMEETERNLKSQIAMQEKKAHESWLAARAAERKLEDTKQEITQLRQKLTLLEREQQSWLNSQDEVIRPVPKRFPSTNDDSINSQEAIDLQPPNMFRPSMPHERSLMLPSDRPLPPLLLPPPPPMPPPYLPHPMDPLIPPPFPPQPWRMPPESIHGTDFRSTPPEINKGRESTPSRERHSQPSDNEMRHTSSPLGNDNRDSCNSTPPHNLPHFHNIPPRPYFPPPMHFSRFPLPPSFRRMHPNEKSKQTYIQQTDSVNSSSHGSQDTSLP